MASDRWALLVYEEDEPLGSVEGILLSQGWRTRHSRNCSEARTALPQSAPPAVVLTDTAFSDGSWLDILAIANAAPSCIPVIVVSRLNDVRLYLDILENGARDFIAPPITAGDLDYIITTVTVQGPHASPSIQGGNKANGSA